MCARRINIFEIADVSEIEDLSLHDLGRIHKALHESPDITRAAPSHATVVAALVAAGATHHSFGELDETSLDKPDFSEGVMFSMDPTQEISDIEDPHITLAYIGKTSKLDPSYRELCQQIIEEAEFTKFSAKVTAHTHFPEGDDGVPCVFILSSPELDDVRSTLTSKLKEIGVEYSKDHGFVPHMTLGYHGPGECPLPEDFSHPESFEFQGPVLTWGEEVISSGDSIAVEDKTEIKRYKVVDIDVAKRYTYGVVYSPDEVDSWGTYADAETIRSMCWIYMLEHRNISVEHNNGTKHHAVCVENHLNHGPAFELNGQTVPTGAWLVGALWSADAWVFIESGELRGWSMEGWAQMEEAIAAGGNPVELLIGAEFDIVVPVSD